MFFWRIGQGKGLIKLKTFFLLEAWSNRVNIRYLYEHAAIHIRVQIVSNFLSSQMRGTKNSANCYGPSKISNVIDSRRILWIFFGSYWELFSYALVQHLFRYRFSKDIPCVLPFFSFLKMRPWTWRKYEESNQKPLQAGIIYFFTAALKINSTGQKKATRPGKTKIQIPLVSTHIN